MDYLYPVPSRTRSVVASDANGQPRTFRRVPQPAQQAAYRRLAVVILGLDVEHLVAEWQSARAAVARAA